MKNILAKKSEGEYTIDYEIGKVMDKQFINTEFVKYKKNNTLLWVVIAIAALTAAEPFLNQ